MKNRLYSETSGKEKMEWVFNKYFHILKGKILDVGCAEVYLRNYVKDYMGVDIVGNPDLKLDLEKEPLPFADNSFDCVLCLAVLEHLENLDEIFDKLCHITKKWLLISMPSCHPFSIRPWRKLNFHWGLNFNDKGIRHKWYYYISDLNKFIKHKAATNHMAIVRWNWEI